METTDQMLSTPLPGPHAACLAGRICGEEVWKLLRPTEKSMVIADARHDFCLDGITHMEVHSPSNRGTRQPSCLPPPLSSAQNFPGFDWENPVWSSFEDWVMGWENETGRMDYKFFWGGEGDTPLIRPH